MSDKLVYNYGTQQFLLSSISHLLSLSLSDVVCVCVD